MNRWRWALVAAVVAVAALCAALVAWLETRDPLVRLSRAAGACAVRDIEARLCGFPYRPRPTDAGTAALDTYRFRLRALAGEILQSRPHDDHAAGVAALLTGSADDAVRRLTACTEAHPNDASVWNDVAAARYTAAMTNDDPQQLIAALAAADHSIRIKPLEEAVFNRGVALEALGIYSAAVNAYDRSIRTEGESKWAAEARERIVRLRVVTAGEAWKNALPRLKIAAAAHDEKAIRAVVREFPQEAESWSETIFLAEWSDAIVRNDSVIANDRLCLVAAVGAALATVNGDTLIRDTVTSLKAGDTDRVRLSIARAQLSYVRGRKLYQLRNDGEAQEMFVAASRSFAQAGSPMAAVADLYICSILYDYKKNDLAKANIDSLLASVPITHKTLRARLLWDRGLILGQTGRLYEALGAHRRARDIFEAIGERLNTIDMNGQIASEEAILGRRDEAWKARRAIFRDASAAGDNTELQKAVDGAARTEAVAGQWDNAYALLCVAEEPSMRANPRLWANMLFWRALTAEKLRLYAAADADVAAARKAAAVIPDEIMRDRALEDCNLAEATVLLATKPKRSASLLDTYVNKVGENALFLPEALLERAHARTALGDTRRAADDLLRATTILHTRQDQGPLDEWRDAFFHTSDAVARELSAALEICGTAATAFKAIDDARERAYGSTEQRSIPDATAIVEYVVHSDHLSVFVKTTGAVRVTRLSLTEREAKYRCQTFANEQSNRAAAASCAALLLKPIEAQLLHIRDLVIVPDTAFARVPYAALPFGTSDTYLIEHASITVAPSGATAFRRRDAETDRARGRALVAVGNPRFDRSRFPDLDPLPGAEREAITIAKIYPTATVLLGADATRANVLAAMKTAAVLHLGTHAVTTSNPRHSHLVLAPEAEDTGILFLSDIARSSITPSLVVLAGCRTASSDDDQTTVGNLALAFIAAGAANAIGSLDNLDDSSAILLLVQFYHYLCAGTAPADALRSVQMEMLHSPDPRIRDPRSWSAMQLYGAARQ